MSTIAIRDAINGITLHLGMRCIGVRMRYVDEDGVFDGPKRTHQQLEFDMLRSSDNLKKTIVSKPFSNGISPIQEALVYAMLIATHDEYWHP